MKLAKLAWKWRLGLPAVTVLAAMAWFGGTANAVCPAACDWPSAGRDFFQGYFTGQRFSYEPGQSGAIWEGSDAPRRVSNADELIAFMERNINDTSNNSYNTNAGGAAYIIVAMLGSRGPDFNGSHRQGVDSARARWGEWVNLVRAYDAQRWITYDGVEDYCYPYVQANMRYPINDVFFFDNSNGTGCVREDVIIFNNPNTGSRFVIKKSCGNPVGDTDALPPPNPPPTGEVNPPTPPPPPPNPPEPPGYNPGDPNLYSSCTLITGRAEDPNDANYAVPIRITYRIAGSGSVLFTDTGGTAATTGNRTFSRPTPVNEVQRSVVAVNVTVEGRGVDGRWYSLNRSPITIGPCLIPRGACDLFDVAPPSLDPGSPYTVTVGVNYTDPVAAQAVEDSGARMYLRISGPGVNFDSGPVDGTPIGGRLTYSRSMPPTNNVGTYSVRWGVTGTIGAIDCGDGVANNGQPDPPREFPVTNKPYFRINGGDIGAGTGMSLGGTDCTAGGVPPNDNAGIVSWNRNGNPAGNYTGAGTLLGALVRGRLQEFATALTSTGGANRAAQPRGLAVANDGSPAVGVDVSDGLYGGKFAGGDCVPDYFAGATNVQTGNRSLVPAAGTTVLPGFPAGGNISNGTRPIYYVDGNLYINSNVSFSRNYANLAAIPSFIVVVRGNIYIAPGVTRLDGFYIAQPSPADAGNNNRGNIYTCAASPVSAAALDRNLHANCSNALEINGAFSARQVWLMRTAGTVSTTTAAETFNYAPELWIGSTLNSGANSRAEDYDAITSLPPSL